MLQFFKKYYLSITYFIVSLLFTLQSIVYINNRGDQTAFANYAKEFGFFEFAYRRYFTWSSRLLIESITLFFSTSYKWFDITLFLSTCLFFYCFNQLFFEDKNCKSLLYVTPILFLILFPSSFFIGAGLIATITNYLFPTYATVYAWYFISRKSKVANVTGIMILIFAVMQEQFALLNTIILSYFFVYYCQKNKKFNFVLLISTVISFIGVGSALFSPGNAVRKLSNIHYWYPEFPKLSLPTKFFQAYIETNHALFVDGEKTIMNFMFLLLLVIIFISLIKKKYIITFLNGAITYQLLANKLGLNTIFSACIKLLTDFNRKEIFYFSISTIYPILIYGIILILMTVSIYLLFTNKVTAITTLIILAAGYISRSSIALSPTLYASGARTFMPLLFSIFIVIVMLLIELLNTKEGIK